MIGDYYLAGKNQTLAEHLVDTGRNSGELAKSYSEKYISSIKKSRYINIPDEALDKLPELFSTYGSLVGFLHDFGKVSRRFQCNLKRHYKIWPISKIKEEDNKQKIKKEDNKQKSNDSKGITKRSKVELYNIQIDILNARRVAELKSKLKRGYTKFRHPIAALPVVYFFLNILTLEPLEDLKNKLTEKDQMLAEHLKEIFDACALLAIYFHHNEINLSTLYNDVLRLSSEKNYDDYLTLSEEEVKIGFEIVRNHIKEAVKNIKDEDIKKISIEEFNKFIGLDTSSSFKEKYKEKLKRILLDIIKEKFLAYSIDNISDLMLGKEILTILYSSLIEGDWTSSSKRIKDDINNRPQDNICFNELYERLKSKLEELKIKETNSEVSTIRQEITHAIDSSKGNKIILTAPTGIGKTEISLLWALKKAHEIDAKKIIYVLPLKALIEDIYERLKKYFGEGDIINRWDSDGEIDLLESVQKELEDKKPDDKKTESSDLFNFLKVARKYFLKGKIIITTADQILMTYLNNGRYAIRYGMFYDSVFVFDEIQNYGSTIRNLLYHFINDVPRAYLIMTATLPVELKKLGKKLIDFDELIENDKWLEFHKYRDASISTYKESIDVYLNSSYEDILSSLKEDLKNKDINRIAVVVNTISEALELYNKIKKDINEEIEKGNVNISLLHSEMLKDDKDKVLKSFLEDKKTTQLSNSSNSDTISANQKRILVSTQVIETGVNISFDKMYRLIAPLQSIVQSMGRVHRFDENNKPFEFVILYPSHEEKDKDKESKDKDKENKKSNEGLNKDIFEPYPMEDVYTSLNFIKSIENEGVKSKFDFEKKVEEYILNQFKEESFYIEYDYFKPILAKVKASVWTTSSVEEILGTNLREISNRVPAFVGSEEEYKELRNKIASKKDNLTEDDVRDLLEFKKRFININKWGIKFMNYMIKPKSVIEGGYVLDEEAYNVLAGKPTKI
ncbi:MAG: CRISPR-associated nuclease/helicase Cas3 [Candidatus Micrarchaeota archaeon]|nr:MAG: CRISPR-associated nuclease/helicase Cas3 [Candidatus Micrarchaeota archaeon]